MKSRFTGLVVIEAIIIMVLLIGVAVLVVLLNRSASTTLPALPVMPTYSSIFSTTTPLSTPSPSPLPGINTPTTGTPTQSGTATQTSLPLYILNGTPIYPTAYYYNPIRISSSTPIFAPAWTYTPTPFATARVAQTCRNILYPMAVGQQWLYQANALDRSELINMRVLSVNNSQGNVMVTNQTTGSAKQIQVQCEGDAIRSFPFMSVDALFGNSLNSSMTASYLSGALAPNEAAFLNNNWALAWSSQYLVSGTTVINRNGTQLTVTLNNSPITLTCQTLAAGEAAFETIQVAAGTFRSLKVVCTEQGQVTANVNGLAVTGLAEGRSYQWFAPYIGLVKMQVDNASVRIFGFSFSLLTDNSLELRSVISAP
jgi:hypothetical protein